MKLLYIANARIPTEKAHGLQISKMCEVFTELGNDVELIVPEIPNKIIEDALSYYKIKHPFLITYLPNYFTKWMYSSAGFRLFEFSFALSARKYLRRKEVDAIVTRSVLVLFLLRKKHNVYYEMHDFPERSFWVWKYILPKASGIIVTNSWKKTAVIDKFSCYESRVHCAPNGFDPNIFSSKTTKVASRQELGFSDESFVLCYAGMLKTMGTEKGVSTMLKSLKKLPKHVVLLLVGGSDADILEYSSLAKDLVIEDRVSFVGRVQHDEMPLYLQTANVLIAPFPDTPHYRNYMSPIKLFEYLASGKPIISSDLPSVKEILADAGVLTVPDDEDDFCTAVRSFVESTDKQLEYSRKSIERSKIFTWEKRALSIVGFIKKTNT